MVCCVLGTITMSSFKLQQKLAGSTDLRLASGFRFYLAVCRSGIAFLFGASVLSRFADVGACWNYLELPTLTLIFLIGSQLVCSAGAVFCVLRV